jgi:hypothetical protein
VPEKSGMDAADCVALLSDPIAVVAVMDSEMRALKATGAIASVIIKPLNWCMMASSCLVARYCIGSENFSRISSFSRLRRVTRFLGRFEIWRHQRPTDQPERESAITLAAGNRRSATAST